MNKESMEDVRNAIRTGGWEGPTAGLAPGFVQANLVILPQSQAADFLLFCTRNPKPCPLLEVTDPGDPVPRKRRRGPICGRIFPVTGSGVTGSWWKSGGRSVISGGKMQSPSWWDAVFPLNPFCCGAGCPFVISKRGEMYPCTALPSPVNRRAPSMGIWWSACVPSLLRRRSVPWRSPPAIHRSTGRRYIWGIPPGSVSGI